jgi:hypothetical protein
MVGLIATTLLAGARMPAGATSNMKRKIPRDAADRIAVAGPERDVRNLVPFLRREKCFFLTSPFIEPHFFVEDPPKGFVGSLPPSQTICVDDLRGLLVRIREFVRQNV